MKLIFAFIASFALAFGVSAAESSDAGRYLRIVNLLPIGVEKVDVFQGEDPYLVGAKPGFIRNYTELVSSNDRISIRRGGNVLADVKLENAPEPSFYTLVIGSGNGSSVEASVFVDSPKRKEVSPDDPTAEGRGIEKLPRRVRLFAGGYDFPITVRIAGIGEWPVTSEGLEEDIELPATSFPESVEVEFEDRYDEKVKIYFPTDFTQAEQYSVFVSQRGRSRPRIAALPDNILPAGDPLAEEESSE